MAGLRWGLIFCLLLLLTGCAEWLKKSSPEAAVPVSEPSGNAPVSSSTNAPPSEPVVLRVLISDDLDIPRDRIEADVRLFEQTSGLQVSLEIASPQEIAGRLVGGSPSSSVSSPAAGPSQAINVPLSPAESFAPAPGASSAPGDDVIVIDTRSFGDMVERKLLAVADTGIASGLKRSPALSAFEEAGRIYALPIWADVRVLVYNPAHLAQAGLPPSPPSNLGDFRKQAQIIKRKGVAQTPYYALWTDEGIVQEFLTWIGSYEGSAFDQQGRPAFMQDPGKKALQFMISLSDGGLLNRDAASSEHQALEAIAKGGHTFGACWLSDLDTLPEPYGVSLLPVSMEVMDLDRTFATSLAVYKGLGVTASSKHPKEAWRLAAFLAATLKSHRLQWMEEPSDRFDPDRAIAGIAFAQSHPALPVARRNEVIDILARYLRAAMDKTSTVENTLNQAAREILELRGGSMPPAASPQPQTNAPPARSGAPQAQESVPPGMGKSPSPAPGSSPSSQPTNIPSRM